MNLLLDTHVWLWALVDAARLPRFVRARVAAKDAALWLSPVSVWEALLLAERGRIATHGDARAWVRSAATAGPWKEVPLTTEIAIQSRSLVVGTEDPADRFLAATALVHGLTLVTADRRLARIPGVEVLAFRPAE